MSRSVIGFTDEIRAISDGSLESLFLPPPGDDSVISRQEHRGHGHAGELGGAGVMGRFEPFPVSRKGLFFGRPVVSEDAGDEANDRIDNDRRGEGSISQDIIADGDFLIDESFDDTVIDSFVMSTEEDEMFAAGQCRRLCLTKRNALGSEKNDPGVLRPEISDSREKGLGFHDHPGTAAVRDVVDLPVFVGRVVAQIVKMDLNMTGPDGPADDAGTERAAGNLGENGNDVYPHQTKGAQLTLIFESAPAG